jgi:PAS domain-containing protein
MTARSSKNLVLIVGRELGSLLATPFFLVDAAGNLVFYNESAEQVLGLRFSEAGELSIEQWGTMWSPEDANGTPLEADELPLVQALSHRKPAHRPIVITGADGKKVEIEVTAVPLFASAEQLVGAAAIFWIG